MGLCEQCKYATWDCDEYYSSKECGLPGGNRYFVDDCKKMESLTDDECRNFFNGDISSCEQYEERYEI